MFLLETKICTRTEDIPAASVRISAQETLLGQAFSTLVLI